MSDEYRSPRVRLAEELPDRWDATLPGAPDLGRTLVARYAEPWRRYHDGSHLARVLMAIDDLADEADDVEAVRLAAWYHDAVYDVHANDNEERSAALAEVELGAAGVSPQQVAEVARLVHLTATHAAEPGDANGAALCDADLCILASPVDTYDEYAADVRAEYAHVPDADFRAGRAAILHQLLALPALFATRRGTLLWEADARANVERELRALASGG